MPCPNCGHVLELLTVSDVARLLRVSEPKLYGLIRRGEFVAPTKLGRQSRWFYEDVHAYIERLRKQPRELAPRPGADPTTPDEEASHDDALGSASAAR